MLQDIKFYTREGIITFEAFQYAYNKGADARMTIERETSLQNGQDYDNHTKVTIKDKFSLYGLTYKDLKALSKWASKAATQVKKAQIKGKYGYSFDINASVNDENAPKVNA